MSRSVSAGVLVLHAWWGLNDDVLAYAERLRREGYTALAPDLYRGRVATTIDDATALRDQLDQARATNDVDDALTKLIASAGRVAVLGWSMGGSYGWQLVNARGGEIHALVTYYGLDEVDAGATLPPILGHFAEHDDFESVDALRRTEQRLIETGADVQLHIYLKTKHWFDEPSRPEFDKGASALAFDRTLTFLERCLRR